MKNTIICVKTSEIITKIIFKKKVEKNYLNNVQVDLV